MSYGYSGVKKDPLTEDEIKQKYKDIKEELQEVFILLNICFFIDKRHKNV